MVIISLTLRQKEQPHKVLRMTRPTECAEDAAEKPIISNTNPAQLAVSQEPKPEDMTAGAEKSEEEKVKEPEE